MQNKGLIKLFAILFGIVSIYSAIIYIYHHKIEKDAKSVSISQFSEGEEDFVAKREAAEARYLDSIGNVEVYNIGIC